MQLKVLKKLRDFNISLSKVKNSIDYLKENVLDKDLPMEHYFVTDGNTIFELSDDKDLLMKALKSGELSFFLPIGQFVNEVIKCERDYRESKKPA